MGNDRAAPQRQRSPSPPDESILAEALAVRRANLPVLSDPVVMTRWLCGITSPALTKSKLSSHRLFGTLGNQSFAHLRDRLEREVKEKSCSVDV